ncbi:hypothetical protein HRbin41_00491 [bacterium HR41]|nr:hypothetical protein HRbin41_00491 [bacterium HR41]
MHPVFERGAHGLGKQHLAHCPAVERRVATGLVHEFDAGEAPAVHRSDRTPLAFADPQAQPTALERGASEVAVERCACSAERLRAAAETQLVQREQKLEVALEGIGGRESGTEAEFAFGLTPPAAELLAKVRRPAREVLLPIPIGREVDQRPLLPPHAVHAHRPEPVCVSAYAFEEDKWKRPRHLPHE